MIAESLLGCVLVILNLERIEGEGACIRSSNANPSFGC